MRTDQLPNFSRPPYREVGNVESPKPFLFCPHCLAEGSADARDYFMLAPEDEIECCGEPMQLVRRHVALLDETQTPEYRAYLVGVTDPRD